VFLGVLVLYPLAVVAENDHRLASHSLAHGQGVIEYASI
jgi:hypothetical protein